MAEQVEQTLTPEQIRQALLETIEGIEQAMLHLRKALGATGFKHAEMPKTAEPAKAEEKPKTPDATTLEWTEVPAPENPKGPWQKTIDKKKPAYAEFERILAEKTPSREIIGGYTYWLNQDGSIGRRKLQRRGKQ